MTKNISAQEKKILNASKLEAYLKYSPNDRIPKNQFDGCARSRILKNLGISASSVGTNNLIENLFNDFDESMGKNPTIHHVRNIDNEAARTMQQKIKRLEERIVTLKAENDALKRAKIGEEWFLDTGRVIMP